MSESGEPELEDAPLITSRGWRNDTWLVGLVTCGFVVARLFHGAPLLLAVGVLLLGVLALRPGILLIGGFALLSWHAGHTLAILEPASTRPVEQVEVTLTADPTSAAGRITAQVEFEGDRLLLSARTAQAGALRTAAVGDRVVVSGSLRGSRPTSAWRISRRIVGQLSSTHVQIASLAEGPMRLANEVRAVLRDSVADLSPERRVLFTGLVFGDDRGQNAVVADNFRAAGLGHLLAVSGQNVVFVLLLAAPVIGRISSVSLRVAFSMTLLAGFGFMTRFEPSVTRALVMAGLALIAHAIGRPGAAPLILPPAVLGLLLVDPLLAWSLAFQLSVAATIGLIVLTPRLAPRIPGPRPVAVAGAATIGAQLAVSPLLLSTFGTLSVVAVPANLLAGPAAAGVMMWGLVAGTIAGLSPGGVARVLHLPTRLMLWWIDAVAATFARIPVGQIGAIHLIVVVGGLTLLLIARRHRRSLIDPICTTLLVCTVAAVALPIALPRQLPSGIHRLVDGVEVVRSPDGYDVVVLHAAAREDDVLAALRQARLGRIDLLIAADGSRSVGRVVRTLRGRFEIAEVWAPSGHDVPGARTVDPLAGRLGPIEVSTSAEGTLVVTLITSQAMPSLEPTIVRAKGSPELSVEPIRLEEHSSEALIEAVEATGDRGRIVAAVDAAVSSTIIGPSDESTDRDELVALVSVLATAGVETFETRHVTTVQRILDTHLAIVNGTVEVLES